MGNEAGQEVARRTFIGFLFIIFTLLLSESSFVQPDSSSAEVEAKMPLAKKLRLCIEHILDF
jgi:hypothetical protein